MYEDDSARGRYLPRAGMQRHTPRPPRPVDVLGDVLKDNHLAKLCVEALQAAGYLEATPVRPQPAMPSLIAERPDNPALGFTLGAVFKAKFPNQCSVDPAHSFKKGDIIGRITPSDNPMSLGVRYACSECTTFLKKNGLRHE